MQSCTHKAFKRYASIFLIKANDRSGSNVPESIELPNQDSRISGVPSFFEVPRNKRSKMAGKPFRKESKGGRNTGMSG